MNKVGSIDMQFSGICKGCSKADLDIHSLTSINGNKWFIRCTHEDACSRMLKLAKGEENVRDQTQEDA
jgi:hypothetical protein